MERAGVTDYSLPLGNFHFYARIRMGAELS